MKVNLALFLSILMIGLVACGTTETTTTDNAPTVPPPSDPPELIQHSEEERAFIAENRSPDVPDLPFDDNPDPTACGIPQQWGTSNNIAYLNGIYEGELYQESVLLYDSHSRLEIFAEAPHGTQVEIILFQDNPVTNYYMVKIPDAPEGANQGWIPAPFLTFDPPPLISSLQDS